MTIGEFYAKIIQNKYCALTKCTKGESLTARPSALGWKLFKKDFKLPTKFFYRPARQQGFYYCPGCDITQKKYFRGMSGALAEKC